LTPADVGRTGPLKSRYDREILRLAVPALGALAAEPVYVLVDTAIVGHLGVAPLAALAIAGTLLTGAFTLFNFLTYGTTAQVARFHGAGDERTAGLLGVQALWLASGIGLVLLALAVALARPAVTLMGGSGHTAHLAVLYMRIAAIGLPFALIALAGQGYLRGVSDLRTPLRIVIASNVANVVLEVVFVYGFGWGVAGSAWGTAIAQAGMGLAFAVLLWRASAAGGSRRPRLERIRPLIRIGREIFVRTAALYGSFVVAGAVLARIGTASLAAHQIAFQLWTFLALVLDSVAIAGQVIVGRTLGAGDVDAAVGASRRMIAWSVALGTVLGVVMLALTWTLPHAFTGDAAVIDRAQAVWPLFALMQPLAGLVFALDGILIGAGDTRYLMWSMLLAGVGVYVPIALAALAFDWGIVGVWCGLIALLVARGLLLGGRFAGRRWAVTGAPASG
jgi:putative MATE family efflux protein